MPLNQTSEIVEKYVKKKKHDKEGDRPLARIIISENKNHFLGEVKYRNLQYEKLLESVRLMVRYRRGHMGDFHRANREKADKSTLTKLNYQYNKNNTYLENKESESYKIAQKRKLKKAKYYIITWAQNNTPIHKELWGNILAYAEFLKAEVHVVLGRYKNPTSVFADKNEEHWAQEIMPYADANRHTIHRHLEILSDIRIQPTARIPLSGMEGISGLRSAIFGHPKQQMETVSALEGYETKLLFTTGAVTKSNYTDSKAGKLGEFHHQLGFVIIEVKDENTFFPRQITANSNGSFNDLYYNVTNNKITKIDCISHAVLGDKHIGVQDLQVEKSQRVWLDRLKPKYTAVHDIFNGSSISHHEEKDPIKKYALLQSGGNLLKRELEQMYKWIEYFKKYNLVVVASNHNDWLDRYIRSKDWKYDLPNAIEYMELSKIALMGKATKGLIAYLIDEKFKKKVITLGRNDSFRVNGIELAQHGDLGANGSKGGINQFKKLSTKLTVGDSHKPARLDGVFYVGTSTHKRLGYNNGASSWKCADVICHIDGKRQHIFYMGDKKEFTTFKK